ncbi:hypothetical protein Tco_1220227 [Tanacetum coccineum]
MFNFVVVNVEEKINDDFGLEVGEKLLLEHGLSMKRLLGYGEEKGDEFSLVSNDDDVVPRVEDVPLVDGFLEGAFDGEGDKDFSIGEGV